MIAAESRGMREALFWTPAGDGDVQCSLCPHHCSIPDGANGICGVRFNMGGKLCPQGYGAVSAVALDPIEKKPLYDFHPGKMILSIGGFGCNLRCPFCQNHEISMDRGAASGIDKAKGLLNPDDIVAAAKETASKGNIGVAYTYNEPLINYEFLMDCAALVRREGLFNVLVTNGFIETGPLEAVLPFIDAMNIDLKGFSDDFYKKAGGRLDPVLKSIEISSGRCHIEVTTLIIPGENEGDVEDIAKWLASIDPDIPLHLSRFFPNYLYSDRAPTSRESMFRLQETAGKYVNRVFTGNMH